MIKGKKSTKIVRQVKHIGTIDLITMCQRSIFEGLKPKEVEHLILIDKLPVPFAPKRLNLCNNKNAKFMVIVELMDFKDNEISLDKFNTSVQHKKPNKSKYEICVYSF